MADYKYLRGDEDSPECVEFSVTGRSGNYITTCVVNVRLLASGFRAFPCGNGDDLKLTAAERLTILRLVRQMRELYRASLPVKTYVGWQKSGFGDLMDYIEPGDETDAEMVDYFVNVLPPHIMRGDLVQAGEPYGSQYDPEGERHRMTYITFSKTGGKWFYSGLCFHGETVNRETDVRAIDWTIKELEAQAR